jgi:hypothetical protein
MVGLVSFFLIGIYVTYFVYDGFGDIYTKASVLENFHKKNTRGLSESINWFFLCVLSMFAIFLLQDNFILHSENNKVPYSNEWLFPLYLLLLIFLFSHRLGGILFEGGLNSDTYSY